jgi:hypothetical protein
MRTFPIAILSAIFFIMLGVAPQTYGQQNPVSPEEEWRRMTPEQKDALREQYRAFKQFPPERKKEIRKRLRQLQAMDPRDRQELRENLDDIVVSHLNSVGD